MLIKKLVASIAAPTPVVTPPPKRKERVKSASPVDAAPTQPVPTPPVAQVTEQVTGKRRYTPRRSKEELAALESPTRPRYERQLAPMVDNRPDDASEFEESTTNGALRQELGYLPESLWFVPEDPQLEALMLPDHKRPGRFNALLARRLVEFYTQVGDTVLDPLGDWGTVAMMATYLGRHGVFGEVVPRYYQEIVQHIAAHPALAATVGYLGDSRTLPLADNSVDYVLTAPPLWFLERYESVEGQLSDVNTYLPFLEALGEVLRESVRVLKPGGYLTLVVSDFRKGWKLHGYHVDTMLMCEDLGLLWHDMVINRQHNNGALLGARKCLNRHYTIRTHEYVMTFVKPT